MTSRAWLLAMAAALAGLVAALTWPDAPMQLRIVVGERQLLGIDLQDFQQVCAQIEKDRADFEAGAGGAEIPKGLSMGAFAVAVSNAPDRMQGTCVRAGVELKDFLEILAVMDKSAAASAELQRWDAAFDERADRAEALAKSLEALGQTPPPVPTPDTKPTWFKDLTPELRESIPVWSEIGGDATAAWAKAMRLSSADPNDEENPK